MKSIKKSEASFVAKLKALRNSIALSASEIEFVRETKWKQIVELERLEKLQK